VVQDRTPNAELEPMTIHDLRHTAASLAVSAGANVKAVQRMLGHASAAMTLDVYSDLFDDDLDAVSDRLDQAVAAAGVQNVSSVTAVNEKKPQVDRNSGPLAASRERRRRDLNPRSPYGDPTLAGGGHRA